MKIAEYLKSDCFFVTSVVIQHVRINISLEIKSSSQKFLLKHVLSPKNEQTSSWNRAELDKTVQYSKSDSFLGPTWRYNMLKD